MPNYFVVDHPDGPETPVQRSIRETRSVVTARERAMFDRGARAVERYGYPTGQYACPTCLELFEVSAIDEGVLTEEHVPPIGLGQGKTVLCLTCKLCNNSAGSQLDAHMIRHDRTIRVLDGTGDGRLRG